MKKNFLLTIFAFVILLIPILVLAYQSYTVRSVYYEGVYGNVCAPDPSMACRYELNFPNEQPNFPSLCGIGTTSVYGAVSDCGAEFTNAYGQCGRICYGTLRYDGFTLTQSSCNVNPGYPQYLCEFSGATCGYPLGKSGYAWTPGCTGSTPSDSYTMSVSPLTQTVGVGGSAQLYTVSISNTYAGTLNLTLAGCPSGSTCTLSSTSLSFTSDSGDDSRNVTLTVTPGTAVAGTYNITTNGNIGGITASATAQLSITNVTPANRASCVSVTAPSTVVSGRTFPVSVRMTNTGTRTWSPTPSGAPGSVRHALGPVTGHTVYDPTFNFSGGRLLLPSGTTVAPGASYTFTANATAPATAGSYPFTFEMVEDGVEWFPDLCSKPGGITVVAPPTCTGAGPTGWTTNATSGGHDVFAYGVSASVTSVKFATWGDPGSYQDDIVWYNGTNMGGGTWKATVDLSAHKLNNPELGNINVHIYMYVGTPPDFPTICSTAATFVRNALPNLTAGGVTPITATVGNSVQFISSITNNGGSSTGASFSNFFQVSATPNGAGPISDLAPTTMSSLASGSSANATSPSHTFLSTGTYSVRACADKSSSGSAGVIDELNEGDNCGAWTSVTVSSASVVPSVTFTGSNPPSPVSVPGLISLSWNVSNNATTCTASGGSGSDGWNGTKPWTNGSHTETNIPISGTTSYTIVCSNSTGNSAPSSITVTASVPNRTVTVTPSSGGTVKSVSTANDLPDGKISCPPTSTCSFSYPSNTALKFIAYPATNNWKFVGWTSSPTVCTGSGSCSFTVNSNTTIQAIFSPKPLDYKEF